MNILDYQKHIGVYRLSPKQKLLLQACVLQGKPALDAWQEWKNSVDIEQLDSASNALLSQLYSNLAAHQVKDLHLARLKGIYKRSWYGNQLLLKKLQSIVRALQTAKIDTIVLGDAAIVAGYGAALCKHTFFDINLLIHPVHLEKAINILNRLGWNLINYSRKDLYWQFQDTSPTNLQLLGQLFWAMPQEHTQKQLWAEACPCQIGDLNTFILSFTDLFLHLCITTFYLGTSQNLNGLANGMILLRQQEAEIDWVEIVTQAQKYQTILPLRNMLTLVCQLLTLSIPDWVLPALHQMPIGNKEFLQYQILAFSKKTILKSLLLRVANYRNFWLSEVNLDKARQ